MEKQPPTKHNFTHLNKHNEFKDIESHKLANRLANSLYEWYLVNSRPLPWRLTKDPYKIWISEVMLQQTTVQAVIPYFNNFIKTFPNINVLSQAKEQKVLKAWAGLGYYSRVKNIHKSSKILSKQSFPKTYSELLKLPGFGPYTSRAVSSIAFNEPVGVVDGNVIRVLSRLLGQPIIWWNSLGKKQLQDLSDSIAQVIIKDQNQKNKKPTTKKSTTTNKPQSSIINQAIMDLGSGVCTKHNPACLLCPWSVYCQAYKKNTQKNLPLSKPKKVKELWIWNPYILIHSNKIALTKNTHAPFLKDKWLLPANLKKIKTQPAKYSFKHAITNYKIYVSPQLIPVTNELLNLKKLIWIPKSKISEYSPYSLISKSLNIHS